MSWRNGLLEWLGQGSDHVESDAPKGWYLRGFAILIITAFPTWLWLVGHSPTQGDKAGWTLSTCPPVAPIPIAELTKHPLRFRRKFIWIVGRIRTKAKVCVEMPCVKGKRCCFPCQARLTISDGRHQVLLDGVLPMGEDRRVACRGTTCQLDCKPFVPGVNYAVAGQAQITSATTRRFARPSFRLRAFNIHRFCRLAGSRRLQYKRRLREPSHRRR